MRPSRDRPASHHRDLHARERQHPADIARLQRKCDLFAAQCASHLLFPVQDHNHGVRRSPLAQERISGFEVDLLGLADEPVQLVIGQTLKRRNAQQFRFLDH